MQPPLAQDGYVAFLTRRRVLTYFRPQDATSQMSRARMVFADSQPDQSKVAPYGEQQTGDRRPTLGSVPERLVAYRMQAHSAVLPPSSFFVDF